MIEIEFALFRTFLTALRFLRPAAKVSHASTTTAKTGEEDAAYDEQRLRAVQTISPVIVAVTFKDTRETPAEHVTGDSNEMIK